MRGITIRQPWAWAVQVGAKTVENRKIGFPKHYRGPVAIHAGKGWSERGERDPRIVELQEEHRCSRRYPGAKPYDEGGIIVAAGMLVDVHPAAGCCEPWGEETYTMNGGKRVVEVAHLVLEDVRQLARPIPWKGALGLWTVPDGIVELILEDLAA